MTEQYKLVPVEPTDEMYRAVRDWSQQAFGKPIGNPAASGCWATMLAAAPEHPSPAEPTDDEIRNVAEKHYGTCMTAQELTFARAILAQFNKPPTPEPLDREAIRNALVEELIEWLETEVSAIDLWYRGDPSYEHDAGYIRDRVMRLLNEAREAFKEDRPAKPSTIVGTIAHIDHGKITLTAAMAAMVLKPAQPSDTKCNKCGQSDNGQTGEYPCAACGLPILHDEQPAQPSDSQAEVSDSEMLDWVLRMIEGDDSTSAEMRLKLGKPLCDGLSGRSAIKAAMRAEREGS